VAPPFPSAVLKTGRRTLGYPKKDDPKKNPVQKRDKPSSLTAYFLQDGKNIKLNPKMKLAQEIPPARWDRSRVRINDAFFPPDVKDSFEDQRNGRKTAPSDRLSSGLAPTRRAGAFLAHPCTSFKRGAL